MSDNVLYFIYTLSTWFCAQDLCFSKKENCNRVHENLCIVMFYERLYWEFSASKICFPNNTELGWKVLKKIDIPNYCEREIFSFGLYRRGGKFMFLPNYMWKTWSFTNRVILYVNCLHLCWAIRGNLGCNIWVHWETVSAFIKLKQKLSKESEFVLLQNFENV